MNIHTASIGDIGRRFRRGLLSPETLVREQIGAIEKLNPSLGCFFTIRTETALAEARVAAENLAAGNDCGPLYGISYAVVDMIDVTGTPTTCGSQLRADRIAEHNADVVEALQRAGAVCLGKAAVFELGLGSPGTDAVYAPARNPHDTSRLAGATGGGAVVATGLAQFVLSPDTGGAVRGSAALCGVVGFKPSFGLISRRGIVPLANSLDHCGVIAPSVSDVAIVMDVLAVDSVHSHIESEPPSDVTSRLSIGLLCGMPGIQRPMRRAVENVATLLNDHGARIKMLEIDYLDQLFSAAQIIYATECFALYRQELLVQPHCIGSNTRARLIVGAFLDSDDYARALQLADRLTQRFNDEIMSGCDIVLSPAAAGIAPHFDASAYGNAGKSGAQTLPFNLTGHPAISVPCGTASGLPLGLQIIGRHGADGDLLKAAHAITQLQSSIQWTCQ